MSEIQALSSGQELEEAVQGAADPGSVEEVLSSHQMGLLTEHRRTLQEELHREMQAEFNTQLQLLEEQVSAQPSKGRIP